MREGDRFMVKPCKEYQGKSRYFGTVVEVEVNGGVRENRIIGILDVSRVSGDLSNFLESELELVE